MRKILCRKGQQDCQDACENGSAGGRAMVTEAFLKEEENNQGGLEEMKDSNNWKFWIIVIIAINIIGFAAMTCGKMLLGRMGIYSPQNR